MTLWSGSFKRQRTLCQALFPFAPETVPEGAPPAVELGCCEGKLQLTLHGQVLQ